MRLLLLAASIGMMAPRPAQAQAPVDTAGFAAAVARFIADEVEGIAREDEVMIGEPRSRLDSLVVVEMASHPVFQRPVRDSLFAVELMTRGWARTELLPEHLRGLPAVVVEMSGCERVPDVAESGGWAWWASQRWYAFRRTEEGWQVAGRGHVSDADGACAVPEEDEGPAGTMDTFRIAMPQLEGRERTIRVYLPPAYGNSHERYPVLYLQDAQNLFSPGAYGDWRVDETLDSLVAAGRTRGVIVVGIDNGERRWDEYGPWSNPRMHDWVDASWSRAAEGGQGAAYVEFLAETLKPEIDRRYRTRPEREHTGIGGSSMGGLISVYAGILRPDVFSRVMAMSTAVWFAEGGGPWLSDNRLLQWMQSRPLPRNVRFWVDVGGQERSRDRDPGVADAQGRPVTYPQAYLEGTQALVRLLRAGAGRDNVFSMMDGPAAHHESAWAARFPRAVLWLYR